MFCLYKSLFSMYVRGFTRRFEQNRILCFLGDRIDPYYANNYIVRTLDDYFQREKEDHRSEN